MIFPTHVLRKILTLCWFFFIYIFFVIKGIVIWRKVSVRDRKTTRKHSKEQIQNDFPLYVDLNQNF